MGAALGFGELSRVLFWHKVHTHRTSYGVGILISLVVLITMVILIDRALPQHDPAKPIDEVKTEALETAGFIFGTLTAVIFVSFMATIQVYSRSDRDFLFTAPVRGTNLLNIRLLTFWIGLLIMTTITVILCWFWLTPDFIIRPWILVKIWLVTALSLAFPVGVIYLLLFEVKPRLNPLRWMYLLLGVIFYLAFGPMLAMFIVNPSDDIQMIPQIVRLPFFLPFTAYPLLALSFTLESPGPAIQLTRFLILALFPTLCWLRILTAGYTLHSENIELSDETETVFKKAERLGYAKASDIKGPDTNTEPGPEITTSPLETIETTPSSIDTEATTTTKEGFIEREAKPDLATFFGEGMAVWHFMGFLLARRMGATMFYKMFLVVSILTMALTGCVALFLLTSEDFLRLIPLIILMYWLILPARIKYLCLPVMGRQRWIIKTLPFHLDELIKTSIAIQLITNLKRWGTVALIGVVPIVYYWGVFAYLGLLFTSLVLLAYTSLAFHYWGLWYALEVKPSEDFNGGRFLVAMFATMVPPCILLFILMDLSLRFNLTGSMTGLFIWMALLYGLMFYLQQLHKRIPNLWDSPSTNI